MLLNKKEGAVYLKTALLFAELVRAKSIINTATAFNVASNQSRHHAGLTQAQALWNFASQGGVPRRQLDAFHV